MHNFANTALWIYIVLLLIGGLIGFHKAKSQVSLITSAVFAVLLALTTLHKVFQPAFALVVVDILLSALLLVFVIRLTKTKKFMPSGLMVVATAITLVLQNLLKD